MIEGKRECWEKLKKKRPKTWYSRIRSILTESTCENVCTTFNQKNVKKYVDVQIYISGTKQETCSAWF